MSIFQFFRILWARRLLILFSTLICFAMGFAFVQLVKPRYEAQSRVMLDIIKPDPVTGQVLATAFLRAYTKTQIELVKDPQTGKVVVDNLKWAKNPAMLKAYRERRKSEDLDFNRWAAQEVANGADARLIEGSNILEISYSSSSPEQAKTVADGLRNAYIANTLQARREAARRNAEWYEDQAQKAKATLMQAEEAKANFERENGIVLGADNVDIDSTRLNSLASAAGNVAAQPVTPGPSPSATALAELDAQLGEAVKILGPNHPTLLAMKRRREVLAAQAAQERNTASTAANAAVSAARATNSLLEAQKAKVMGQREKVERVRLMQDEINLRRDQYSRAVARAAQLRQEAEVAEAGVIPLASAITPQSPVFPKKGLVSGAATAGGLALGVLIAVLLELFARRVRSADDLSGAVDAPVLAVIRNPHSESRKWWRRPKSIVKFPSPLRPKAA